jgi:hypothetical protein
MMAVHHQPPVSRTGPVIAGVLAACVWLAGCAGPFGFPGARGAASPFRDPGLTMQAANEAVVTGQSSRQDVLAALGPATVVRFDSGYEVWVYRRDPLRSDAADAEFVILFAPSGIVKKTRIRPAYARQDF